MKSTYGPYRPERNMSLPHRQRLRIDLILLAAAILGGWIWYIY